MENEFPPNSHTNRESTPERRLVSAPSQEKVVRQVTRSKVTLRRKPLWKKFVEAFRPDDNVGFAEYALLEVLAPGIKDAVLDSVHGAIDNAFGGGHGLRGRRGHRDGGYTSYNRMSESRPRSRRSRGREEESSRGRSESRGRQSGGDFPEVILDSRVEAEEVLDSLIELISKYDAATKRDLLSLTGEPTNPTDEDWGWYDLRGARIHKIRDGYLLDLPRIESLD